MGSRFVVIADQSIVELERQLCSTINAAERHRLLQFLIIELARFQTDFEFSTAIERRIEKDSERYKRQKELVVRLKDEGHDTRDAYFRAVTIKTLLALYGYYLTLARKILVCVFRG